MNVEIASKNSSMGAPARGLCGLLFALAALLWWPAQAAAAPCHGAMQEAPAAHKAPAATIVHGPLV